MRPISPFSRTLPGLLLLSASCGDPFVPEPTTITISPASVTLQALDDTVQLTATVQDQEGRTMGGVTVRWASGDDSVATVDVDGLVTAAGNGVVTMEASFQGVAGSSQVTVAQRVADVRVWPEEMTLGALGDTITLEARAYDANGNVVGDLEFTWSSLEESVARVDAGGRVTSVGNGLAPVEANAQRVSGFSRIRVNQRAAHVLVSPEKATLGWVGDTLRLAAGATDANGHVIEGAKFAWESDRPAAVTVDAAGLVTAAANGVVPVYARTGRARGGALIFVELDRGVLLELYEALGGADWKTNRNWGTDAPLDEWYGVRGGPFVSVLALRENGLTGSIPPEMADLKRLDVMSLEGNAITGSIPAEIGDIAGLQVIVVSDNRLSGPIPSGFGSLNDLSQLEVANNRLTGPIPPKLGDLEQLQHLDLSDNPLIGPVPPEIGDLRKLRVLRVNGTLLSGQLPLELIGLPLRVFTWDETDLCAPGDEEFQEWLKSIPTTRGPNC